MLDLDKLKTDPIFHKLFLEKGEEYILDAGYFEETLLVDSYYEGEEFSLPTANINKNYQEVKPNCILISSGCYNPAHQGHIDMMKVAKLKAEDLGYNVLNAYLSPAHDEYLKTKTDKVLNIFEREKLIYKKIIENNCLSWMDVDIIPGLYSDCDTNFTKIVTRIQSNIKKLFPTLKYKVFYVCGSDKLDFHKAFEQTDVGTFIVSRGEDDYINNIFDGISWYLNINSYFLSSMNTSSSTQERENLIIKPHVKKKLNLRVSNEELCDKRTLQIILELNKHFSKINFILQDEQKSKFKEIFKEQKNIISLDSQIEGLYNLRISRVYDTFGYKYLGFNVWNPEEIKNIPTDKEYILYDDDICGGSTMNYAKKYLEGLGIKIKGYFTFNYTKENEVLDLRDFLFDAKDGGLLIKQTNGDLVRKPYVLPWCNVYERCSILDGKEFSNAIHKINKEKSNAIN